MAQPARTSSAKTIVNRQPSRAAFRRSLDREVESVSGTAVTGSLPERLIHRLLRESN